MRYEIAERRAKERSAETKEKVYIIQVTDWDYYLASYVVGDMNVVAVIDPEKAAQDISLLRTREKAGERIKGIQI